MNKITYFRNTNIIITGNKGVLNDLVGKSNYKFVSNKHYYTHLGNFYIDIITCKKQELIDVLKEICVSPNYYSETVQKKLIIIVNFHLLRSMYQQSIKTIIDRTYNNCSFIIHTNNINSIDRNIISRFIVFNLLNESKHDETLQITYNKIIKLLKGDKLNKDVIITIRELSYMYYMNHTHSTDLQKLLVKRIGSNLYIPNSIKYKLVEDLCRINALYQHSFRKPIFLEFIIISLFKHLEHYTTNL